MMLSANALKWLAITAMLIDHIAWLFVPTDSHAGQMMHFVGRFTAPTMCFLLVEGFYHTRNRRRYLLRLFIFALIAQLPFAYFQQQMQTDSMDWQTLLQSPHAWFETGNVLFNLLFALLALMAWQLPFKKTVRAAMIALLLLFSAWLDWRVYLIVMTLALGLFRDNRRMQITAYLLASMALLLLTDAGIILGMNSVVLHWFPFGILLVPLLWYCYDGTRGSHWGGRYFFYVFYPAHLLILALVAQYS